MAPPLQLVTFLRNTSFTDQRSGSGHMRVTFESLMTRGRPTLRAVCAWVNAGAACSEELLRALPLRRQSDGEYARALAKRVENVDLLAAAFADTCFAEQFAVAYPRQPCASRPWAREWD